MATYTKISRSFLTLFFIQILGSQTTQCSQLGDLSDRLPIALALGTAIAIGATAYHAYRNMPADYSVRIALYRAMLRCPLRLLTRIELWRGKDPNKTRSDGRTLLHYAAMLSDLSSIKLLLNRGTHADVPDEGGTTALCEAARLGDIAILNLLLNQRANVNARNKRGHTPLHFAALFGKLNSVQLLLYHGANVNAQDEDGSTALHWATHMGHKSVTSTLLRNGASINITDNEGNTPLICAALGNHTNVMQLLLAELKLPCYSDTSNSKVQEALHAAAYWGQPDATRLLIQSGANINDQGTQGHTPLNQIIECLSRPVTKQVSTMIETACELARRGAKIKDQPPLLQRSGQGDLLALFHRARKSHLNALEKWRRHMMDQYHVSRNVASLIIAEAGQTTSAMIIP